MTINFEIEMMNGEKMKGELYPETAPNTVKNFISLAKNGFYNNLTFHRVIKGFVIQGGCPEGTGTGGPGYNIPGEFSANGYNNTLKHEKYVLSMARAQSYDSAGSQFFIMDGHSTHLDGQYAAFGRVTEGTEIVDKIAGVKTDYRDCPEEKIAMKQIKVDQGDFNYSDLQKV